MPLFIIIPNIMKYMSYIYLVNYMNNVKCIVEFQTYNNKVCRICILNRNLVNIIQLFRVEILKFFCGIKARMVCKVIVGVKQQINLKC